MIASDKDVKEFLDLINNVIPPQVYIIRLEILLKHSCKFSES